MPKTVQGVFFRSHTTQEAQRLGLVGFCRNTKDNTVAGELQGPEEKVNQMKEWLREVGSPASQITHVDFKAEENVSKTSYQTFEVLQ